MATAGCTASAAARASVEPNTVLKDNAIITGTFPTAYVRNLVELPSGVGDDQAVDGLEQFRGLMSFDIGHAGNRFVDQQQFWILRQQHSDLEPLLLTV